MTNNDTAYQTALDLTAAGVSVAAVVIHRIGFAGGYLLAGAVVLLSAGGFFLLIRDFSPPR